MRIKLLLLDVFAIVFASAWVVAGASVLYFLYGAVSSGDSWRGVILAAIATMGTKLLADLLGRNHQRLDYVNKLLRRGYSPAEACAAWRTAAGGGFNLLMSLQQSDTAYGHIFLGRELDAQKPDSPKILRWNDSLGSGTDPQ